MGIFQRISATLSARVDQAVTRVENHDAVVAAAIRNTQAGAARAKVRLVRVQKDGKALKKRLEELTEAEATWTDRAKRVGDTDKQRALECLRRRKLAQQQLERVKSSLEQHQLLETQVGETLRKIEHKLQEMKQQRNLMRSRESAANAMRLMTDIYGEADGDIEETFDRWETLITESEFVTEQDQPLDNFDQGFETQEESQELEAELAILLSEDKS